MYSISYTSESAELAGLDFYLEILAGSTNVQALDIQFISDCPCGNAGKPVIDQRRANGGLQVWCDRRGGGHPLLLAVKTEEPQLALNDVEIEQVNAHTDLA